MQLAILDTSILSAFGSFEYKAISLEDAKLLCLYANDHWSLSRDEGILSVIWHESTATILTFLLGTEITMNRIQFALEIDQRAIIFKLKGCPHEGKILSIEEIEEVGYEFGLLTRLSDGIEEIGGEFGSPTPLPDDGAYYDY